MEKMMLSLPLFLDFNDERAWLTVTSSNNPHHWTAFYMCQHGNGIGNFYGEGKTPTEALEELKSTVDLLALWDAPTGLTE